MRFTIPSLMLRAKNMVKQNPCGLKIWNQIEKALYFHMQPDQNSYEIVKWVKNEVYIQEIF